MSVVSFRRLYPDWLFPGESDRDPSREPLLADNVKYWVDTLNPLTWIFTSLRLYRLKPDLIILPWWTPFLFPAWLVIGVFSRLFVRVPLVFICHNVLPHEVRLWDLWIARTVLRLGTRFVVQSESERVELRRLLPNVEPSVVPHPVYDMFSQGCLSRGDARQTIDVPDDIPVLLFFGIVREYKGLMDVLSAMPKIRRQLGRVLLIIAGEFWEPRELYEQRIDALGIRDCVRIYDRYIPNEEVPTYFRAADLVVAPYRRVTGSGVAQMAIGFGVPLLTTQTGLRGEAETTTGYMVVPSGDSDAIAESATAFLMSDSVRCGESLCGSLNGTFSWDRLADILESYVDTHKAN